DVRQREASFEKLKIEQERTQTQVDKKQKQLETWRGKKQTLVDLNHEYKGKLTESKSGLKKAQKEERQLKGSIASNEREFAKFKKALEKTQKEFRKQTKHNI